MIFGYWSDWKEYEDGEFPEEIFEAKSHKEAKKVGSAYAGCDNAYLSFVVKQLIPVEG